MVLENCKCSWIILQNRDATALKSLVRCTHFLTRHHIAHSTNFTQLVDLVVSCGARELQVFLDNTSKMQCTHPVQQ